MSLMEQLSGAVQAQFRDQAAAKTGLDAGTIEALMPMAMGALMGGLKNKAKTPTGAQALEGELANHDGSILNEDVPFDRDDIMAQGQNLLGQILGGRQGQAEAALAETAGVNQGQVNQLLAMAAPALLGALSKTKQQQGLDVSALSGLLDKEAADVQSKAPPALGGLMSMLDADGDGDIKDDLVQAAQGKGGLGGLLGGLFRKK